MGSGLLRSIIPVSVNLSVARFTLWQTAERIEVGTKTSGFKEHDRRLFWSPHGDNREIRYGLCQVTLKSCCSMDHTHRCCIVEPQSSVPSVPKHDDLAPTIAVRSSAFASLFLSHRCTVDTLWAVFPCILLHIHPAHTWSYCGLMSKIDNLVSTSIRVWNYTLLIIYPKRKVSFYAW